MNPEALTRLLEHCQDFARTMLEEAGEFYPFGAFLDASGQVHALGADDGNEHPTPAEIYQLLCDGLASRVAECEAVAIALNVNIPPDFQPAHPDGVRVEIEAQGYARAIYAPYTLRKKGLFGSKRIVTFAELFAVEIDSRFYPTE